MPDGPLIDRQRAELLRRERETATRLVKEYGRIYANLQGEIEALNAELAAMVNPSPGKLRKMARFLALRERIEAELSRYGAWADTEITAAASDVAQMAPGLARQLALANLPPELRAIMEAAWTHLPTQTVQELLTMLAPGSPLHQALVTDLGPTIAKAVEEALLDGIALGYNPRKVAAIIRKTLGQGLSWALRTSRTSMLYAHRQSTMATYRANSGIVKGWIWHAELGPRTCIACIAQHGTEHTLDETLNDHHNGRCAMVPKTISWADLGYTGIPERAPMQTGREWFEKLSPGQQAAMFENKAMYRAWQKGAIGWDDLIGEHEDAVYGKMLQLPSLEALLGAGANAYYK